MEKIKKSLKFYVLIIYIRPFLPKNQKDLELVIHAHTYMYMQKELMVKFEIVLGMD